MRYLFKNNNQEEEDKYDSREESANDILDRLYESNSDFRKKLDFNVEHLNQYLIKSFKSYLDAIYKQDPSLCQKYVSPRLLENIIIEIEDTNQTSKYSNQSIELLEANLEKQSIETINYISYILIKFKVYVSYNKTNLYIKNTKTIEELFTINALYKNTDNGWIIDKITEKRYLR